MSKLKQCIYTLILLVTCVVASPFIYKQIWDSSNIKKPKAAVKEPTAVTQPAETTTTAGQDVTSDCHGSSHRACNSAVKLY